MMIQRIHFNNNYPKEIMKNSLLIVGFLAAVVAAQKAHIAEKNRKYINHEMVQQIKAHGKWTPFEVSENPLLHTRDIEAMIGSSSYNKNSFFSNLFGKYKLTSNDGSKQAFSEQIKTLRDTMFPDEKDLHHLEASSLLPAFDSRTEWPSCIHGVRD